MWDLIKLVGSFMSAHKLIISIVTAVTMLGSLAIHLYNDGERAAELAAAESKIEELEKKVTGKNVRIIQLNHLVAEVNRQNAENLAEAERRIEQAKEKAAEVHVRNEEMAAEIGALRYRMLELIDENHEYADWAFDPVHPDTWRLLKQAGGSRADPL